MSDAAVTTATPDRRNAFEAIDAFRRAATEDAFGHRIHVGLAIAWAFFFPLVMIPWAKDVALVLLVGWSLARVLFGGVRYAWGPIFRMPIAWLLTAWLVWTALSLTWTPALMWGLDEFKSFRSFLIPIAVFPVLFEFRKMLWAFLVGIAIVNIIQLLQAAGLPGFGTNRPDRYCAWIAPNPGGLLVAAAFMAHVAWIIAERRGRVAAVHVAGAVLAGLGVIFMQNRGAFVATSVGMVLLFVVVLILRPRARATVLLVATSIVFGLSAGIWIDDVLLDSKLSAPIKHRATLGLEDLTNAKRFKNRPVYRRSVTYRLEVWEAMLEDIQDRPLLGTGMGGLWHAFDDHPEFNRSDRSDPDYVPIDADHKHGHNSWLFVPAATGLIGMALMWGTLATGIVGLARRMRQHPEAVVGFSILITWMIANVFDTLILSGSTSCLLILGLLGAFIPRSSASP